MDTSMQGKICMVTGATSGMGKATAAALAEKGATVILVARTAEKGERVRDELRAGSRNPRVEALCADLSSQAAIHALAETFTRRYQQLDVLVNNAGGIFFRRETTVDGLEMTLAVNHLAPFLLTHLLLDVLRTSSPARIINISSSVERVGSIAFRDLQRTTRYVGFTAYAQAKLALLLATYDSARRLDGTGVTVNAVVPGPVATNFGKQSRVLSVLFGFARSAEDGAQTAIYLASAPQVADITGQAFYHKKALRSSRASHNLAIQRRLWQVSEDLTGIAISAPTPAPAS
jgi:NAD(P)-dependent dehydrogenase (short-subunit alcohol dehydrogenase family)